MRAAIYGLAGPDLSPSERAFFAEADPWGFILFARNIDTPVRLKRLTADLRESVGRDAPILIDQEGGRVARLRGPHWREWPPVREEIEGARDEGEVLERLRLRYRLIAHELREVGIDVDCAPLLDVPQRNAHPIIGNRALGDDGVQVALRGREVARALLEGGVLPVIKHLPGHGRALDDSHEHLPTVTAPAEVLRSDFLPFRALADQALGMTAHIVFTALDPEAPATLSRKCIDLIRHEIGFDGLLMTDDLSMHALKGPMRVRAEGSLAAGCDLVLHCNGDPHEMAAVAEATPALTAAALTRSERALALRRAAPFDPLEAEARYRALATGRAA
ncbi:MAG: glycoside hydrolase family 3 N-terminal domain-containing protein [Pseudomonadota bacterium]